MRGDNISPLQCYAKDVAITVVCKYYDNFGFMEYLNKSGKVIMSRVGELDSEFYPRFGKVIEVDNDLEAARVERLLQEKSSPEIGFG